MINFLHVDPFERSDLQQEALHVTKGTGQITKYNWPIVHSFKMFSLFRKTPKVRGENRLFVLVLSTKEKKRTGVVIHLVESGNNKMSQSARKTGFEPFRIQTLFSEAGSRQMKCVLLAPIECDNPNDHILSQHACVFGHSRPT